MFAHREVQAVAKAVLADIVETITPASTEQTIVLAATRMLAERGLADTWYYRCPALVLSGSRSCLSVSGRDYLPSDEPVGQFNLVTIDLSPRRGAIWGDCARSIFVEEGVAGFAPRSSDFLEGQQFLDDLHRSMQQFVSSATRFQELWEFANDHIRAAGFANLDFLGNVGHSIASRLEDRHFVEDGNSRFLSDVLCFTFEPHVRSRQGRWGFKREDMYYFNADGLTERV